MVQQQQQPLTSKEMSYLCDSMSNEDIITKQCVSVIQDTQNQTVKNELNQIVQKNQQHYNDLLSTLQNHVSIAPSQPQS